MRTRRNGSAVALIALVVVGLSGCMKVDADLTLQSDDTISGTMLMAYTNELAESLGQTPDTMIKFMGLDSPETDPGETFTVEPYSDDDYMGATITFDGSPLDRFGGNTLGMENGLVIERDGDEFVVSPAPSISPKRPWATSVTAAAQTASTPGSPSRSLAP
jgi:hypothetical protein